MQDPPEMIADFVGAWESGERVVAGIKSRSRENRAVYALRQVCCSFMDRAADVGHVEQFTGFGLYDRSVLDVLRRLDDPLPYLRGMVSLLSVLVAASTFVLKSFRLVDYPVGTAAVLFGVFFLGGTILLFMGILGEYIMNINIRTMRHPIVVEKEGYNLHDGK